jgi:hypothetical protein
MLRFLLLLCAALTSVLALAGGAGSAQSGSQGAENLVAGTGTLICCDQPMVHVNAQSLDGGVDPRGHFWIRYPNDGGEFGGPVVCLNVALNVATVIGHIERVKVARESAGFVFGNYIRIRITDAGSPGTTDMVNFEAGQPVPDPCFGAGDRAISQGNYIVHDEPVVDLSALNLLLAQFEAEANDPYGG